MAEKNKIIIDPPEGFVAPEGTQEGGTFDVVDTWRLEKGGKLCLLQLGDTKAPGYGKEEKRKADYSDMVQSMQSERMPEEVQEGY